MEIKNELQNLGNKKEGTGNEKWQGMNMALMKNLESKDIEARYKSVLLNLRSKFDIPDDLTDKIVKIVPNDSIQDKFNTFPRVTFSDNGIYIATGNSIYMFRNLGNRWENVLLPRREGRNDRTGGFGVEMYVNKICKNADNCSIEIKDKKDDSRLK